MASEGRAAVGCPARSLQTRERLRAVEAEGLGVEPGGRHDAQVEVGQRGGLGVRDVPPGGDLPARAAGQEDGEVGVTVGVTVFDLAGPEDQPVVEQGPAVGLGDAVEALQQPR